MLNSLGVNFPAKRRYIQEKLQLHIKIKKQSNLLSCKRKSEENSLNIFERS